MNAAEAERSVINGAARVIRYRLRGFPVQADLWPKTKPLIKRRLSEILRLAKAIRERLDK